MSASGEVIRVRGVAELIALLPYQLGYQPRQSLVMTLLGPPDTESGPAAGAVMMQIRMDIPAPEVTDQVIREVQAVCGRERPAGVQVLLYTDARDAEHAVYALRLLGQACIDEGIVVDVLAQVSGGFWCRRTRLDEPDRKPSWARVPELADVPAAADLVLRGASPLQDREELGRALDTGRPLTHQAVRDELLRLEAAAEEDAVPGWGSGVWLDPDQRCYRVWGRVLHTGPDAQPIEEFDAADLALTVWSLWNRLFRDCLLEWVAPDQFTDLASSAEDPGVAAIYRMVQQTLTRVIGSARPDPALLTDRLMVLCARTPREVAAPVLTLLAMHSWAKGEGTLANVAVERALAVDPDYRLAQLLDQALAAVVRPRRFAETWAAHHDDQDPDAA